MDHDDLLARVRELRAEGCTPKAVARALGLTAAQVKPLIREAAAAEQVEPTERPLVACLVNPQWSVGLGVDGTAEWPVGDSSSDLDDADGPQGLASVLLARRHRWGRVSVCGFLADVHCLGVKNALGPRIMTDAEWHSFRDMFFAMFPGDPVDIPIDLARHLVFGAVDYARSLGFEPHPDFALAAPYLGTWTGQSLITFGRDGRPFWMQGPDDDPRKVLATLDRTVGAGNYDFFTEAGDVLRLR